MAEPIRNRIYETTSVREVPPPTLVTTTSPVEAKQAYQILLFVFTVAPIIAGLDKFSMLLTDWTKYLAPVFPNMLGISALSFMKIVGVIEIVAGIGVYVKPSVFGYVVAAWLAGIIVNLAIVGGYYDVALRDFGLCLSAIALARLSRVYEGTSTVNKKVMYD